MCYNLEKEWIKVYNILVCDDDKEIVEAIQIYLAKEGYNIFKAYNGEQVLKIIEEKEIHLIILDIMMPKINGIEVATRIRQNQLLCYQQNLKTMIR